jgi:ABC-type proline/glycine betaine transport system ATPase subunit
MAEAKAGKEFVKHEFDEAIAVQQAIVEAERILREAHPMREAKTAISKLLKSDEQALRTLQTIGKRYGATGKAEDVAKAMQDLSKTTTKSAEEAPSEAYEAHAVLLAMIRKQQDSAGAVTKIAREIGDTEAKTAAVEMQRASKQGGDELAKLLATFAVQIAESGEQPAAAK